MVEDKTLSIAVIAHDVLEGGSVGSIARNHINLLAMKFQVYVISKAIPETENPNIRPILVAPKNWDWLRRFCHVPNELSFLLAARKALIKLSEEVDLKAVWCHSHGVATISASPIARRKKFSVIMTTHGDIFERPPGTYDKFMTLFYKLVTMRAYSHADRVQALSPYMGELAEGNGASAEKIRIIPNGIYPEEIGLEHILDRQRSSFDGDVLRIVFVGNLLPIKGLKYLIEALHILRKRNINNFSLQCVGDGPEMSSLKALSKTLSLEPYISFKGRLLKTTLGDVYNSADVLCVPSDSDPLPTVVLEAFSAGLPVVGADTGGIAFMVNKERGALFKPGDQEELANLLTGLASNKAPLLEMSKACSTAARNEFCWDTVGDKLVTMLMQCISDKTGASGR